jgi:hypothetical protein
MTIVIWGEALQNGELFASNQVSPNLKLAHQFFVPKEKKLTISRKVALLAQVSRRLSVDSNNEFYLVGGIFSPISRSNFEPYFKSIFVIDSF